MLETSHRSFVCKALTLAAFFAACVGVASCTSVKSQRIALTAQQHPCVPNEAYSGPTRRQVPELVWYYDFTRSINGTLPTPLIAALENVTNDFTHRAPAMSIAVAIPGMGRWSISRGLAHADHNTPLPTDARFQVASTTKTLTAITILQMEGEGKLSTSSSIKPWFPDVPNAEITTVDHLLRHQSGLMSFNALSSWTFDYRQPREVIEMAVAEPPQFCPGSNFSYSNTGYAMLGVIIEELEKRTLSEIFQKRFALPLNMRHTSLRHPGDDISTVSGHVNGVPVEVPDRYATPFASGSLASTAEDLVTFWHAFLSGQLVPSATVRAMFTDLSQMDDAGHMFYGSGVQLYDVPEGPGLMLGHSGGITGFASVVAYVVEDDMYVSVIFNDQAVPAEAGLWAVVRAVRAARKFKH